MHCDVNNIVHTCTSRTMIFKMMCWFQIVFYIFCISKTATVKASEELHKKYISEPHAICNDNSRATFYIGPKSSKKWIVFFESGGFCGSFEDCNRRYLDKNSTILMTSITLPDKVTGRDLLSASKSENPTFFEYTHVLVPYCSSDLWLGLKSNPKEPFRFVNDSTIDNFSFRGQTIFRSVFVDLLLEYDLSDAEEIILAGSSAGGIGVLNHADWVLNYVIKSHGLNAKLLSIIDSAWFIDFQGSFKAKVKPDITSFANISSRACSDHSHGYTCCPSASCMIARGYYPSSVPLLLISSLYDVFMFLEVFKKLEDEGKTAADHSADYLSVVNMYGGAMNESLTISEEQASNVSFFTPACFQHIYLSTSSLWDDSGVFPPPMEIAVANAKFRNKVQRGTWETTEIQTDAKNTSLKDFIATWVKSGGTSMKLIDSCIGAQCNPTCPKQLFFTDPAVNWIEVLKTVIVILSLVVTVTCFGLKSIFMLYHYYLAKKQKQYLNDPETSVAQKELPPCEPNETISIACLALSYSVDIKRKKAKKDEGKPPLETNVALIDQTESSTSLRKQSRQHSVFTTLTDDVFVEEDSSSTSSESLDKETIEELNSLPKDNLAFDSTTEPMFSVSSTQDFLTKTRVDSNQNGQAFGQNSGTKRVKKSKNHKQPQRKEILKNVSVYFNPGELVAIMGPSGCGKTTLLDLLTGRRQQGYSKGEVYINGVPRSHADVQDWYSRKIGYVLQLAVPYYEELTVRQNLFFAAHMRLPKSMCHSRKFERVEQILDETGLTSLADTVVGGSMGQGLSGGQKRRLCVALQMINLPSVLFLDEPTSGLDASSSLELLNHLNLVAESGRLVILTIHQPRLEIFHLFHKIILMYDGQVAYYGEPTMAPTLFLKAYLQSTTEEFRLSEDALKIDGKNPADIIMDLLNCSHARQAILDYYQRSGEPQAVQEAIKTSQGQATNTFAMFGMRYNKKNANGAGTFNRIFVLEGRTSERQTLGQILYFPLIFFMFGLLEGTVYFRAQDRDGFLVMAAYCVYCISNPLFLSSILISHLNKTLKIFHLERADGCGRAYEIVIQTYVRTAALCVIPVLLLSAMSYFMVMTSYDVWKFVLVTVISLVINQAWIAIYIMAICAHPGIAHRICPLVSAAAGFAGGFMVPRPAMPPGYNLLFYINPTFYGYAAITKVLLQDARLKCEYDSILNCISTDGNAVLARFGFDAVNVYEYLVIMLALTVISLIFSWLFLEMKYVKIKFSTKTSSALSQVDEPYASMELQHNPGHTVHQTRRKSTLRVVTEDEGLHTIKLPRGSIPEENQSEEVTESMRSRTSSTKSREMRWQSVRKRVAEKRLSTNLEMKNVRRLARQSTLIPARSQFQEIPIRKQNVSIPLARSTSFPIIKERIPEKKRTLSCDDLPKLETESQEDSFGGKKEDLLLPQFSSATFNVIEEESPEETNLL